MHISLQKQVITGFRSVRKKITLDYTKLPTGLYFIEGWNEEAPRLGSNGCLIGDTLVDCPRDLRIHSKGIPIRDLVGKQFYTYTWNVDKDSLDLSWVSKVWQSGVKEVYKVCLTAYPDGRNSAGVKTGKYLPPCEIIGTYDHPILLCNGTWKKLGELKKNDSLKSFYRRNADGRDTLLRWSGQEETIEFELGRRILREPRHRYKLNSGVKEHQFVCEVINGEKPKNTEVHHIDENHLNQSPDNLIWKNGSLHKSEHTSKRNKEGKAGWKVSGVHPRGMLGKTHTKSVRKRTVHGKVSGRKAAASSCKS